MERDAYAHSHKGELIRFSPLCLWREGGCRVVTCCSRWLISSSPASRLLPLVHVPPVEEDAQSKTVHPPWNQERRSFILEGAGHLKLKFVARLPVCSHAGSGNHHQTDGRINCRIHVKQLCWSQELTGLTCFASCGNETLIYRRIDSVLTFLCTVYVNALWDILQLS